MNSVKKVLYLLDKKEKLRTVSIFIMIIIGSFVELLGIAIVLPIIELAMDTGEISENIAAKIIMMCTNTTEKEDILLILIGITIIIYIFKTIYLVYMNSRLYIFSMDIKRHLSIRLLGAYYKQPYQFFLNNNSADLIRAVSYDTSVLYDAIMNILRIVSSGFTVISIVVFLFITNPLMTLVVSGLIIGCALVIFLFLNRKYRYYGEINQKLSGSMTKDLRQSFEAIKEIKVMGIGNYFIKSYEKTYKEQCQVMNKYNIYNTLPKYLVETVCISGILCFLALNIIFSDSYLSLIPQLATFCVAAYKLLPAVNGISSYANGVAYSYASIDLVYNKIKETEKLLNKKQNDDIKEKMFFNEEIHIKNVSFGYAGTKKNVIQNAEFKIKKGESIALVGPSGGGKTTLADIILGLLEPLEGKILVDKKDIQENISGWCKNIGYIPQTIYLTDDTIRNNVAFGIEKKEIDDEQVWKALEGAQLKDFVKDLPQGLDTEVGERGARISGGQRQRIGIARALYRNPDILVFDEATSALDNETEKEVMKAIEGLQGTKTMIMIAHRLTTIEKCDFVYKIENSKVEKVR